MPKFLIRGGYSKCSNLHSRNLTIDFIRGIAILLVVLGHNIQFGSGSAFYETKVYFEDNIFKFIYSFHMPLFALLSGYLFFWSVQKPVKTVLKKRLTSLLLPIFCWVTLECLGRAVIMILKHEFAVINFTYLYASKLLGSLWFLWAIFWCSLVVLLVEKVFGGRVWIYGVLMIPLVFSPAVYNFHMYTYMYPYFVVGFLFNKFDGKNNYQRLIGKDWQALTTTFVVFATLFIFYGRDFYIYTTEISLLGESGAIVQLGIDIYRWIIGFVGSAFVIILCKMICDRWQGNVVRLFAYLGQISLGVYILNSFVNSYVLRRVTAGFSPNIIIWTLETIVSMVLYTVAVEIIKKIPAANKLLLGGR